ncbi:MAG: class I SAM-dependent methyltransferase [Promethearchaeota archaeon]
MNLRFHTWLFNFIAYFYRWFFKGQAKGYTESLEMYENYLEIPKRGKILDIGCGTGAFGYAFKIKGYDVQGIDIAKKMVKHSKRKELLCEHGNILEGLRFADNSFDLVIAGFVLHGLDREKREIFYKEAGRIAKKYVLFHDYSKNKKWNIAFIEWIERGDYFNFIKAVPEEFENNFERVQIFKINSHSAWYLCKKKNNS